ncbi:hypothetical protein MPTK1_7g13200 [Marchantia polymorpha subsp. ruderalis]|uniref:Uncharacterized protein n=2 Tax=Marchantia polymorpha TaxID=3197 RepID=A0AAF6BZ31_MARPO|nr:hypothetical protein MARPO_0009s0006 [Marchantia polymorpha]BBN17265.1 hypothetical protein Mp_7g13200 [Marchantia polymorpha subsp. ruderalis]|eukprot:PTQ46870.1 hypothetical protein MARPO_0009s0006 [Marchantia polymorpha]
MSLEASAGGDGGAWASVFPWRARPIRLAKLPRARKLADPAASRRANRSHCDRTCAARPSVPRIGLTALFVSDLDIRRTSKIRTNYRVGYS